MVRTKSNSVKLDMIDYHVYNILYTAGSIYERYGVDLIITSGHDSKHSIHSTHYAGLAVDLRIWNLPKSVNIQDIADELQRTLGFEYYILLEKDHIHCQYTLKNVKH